MPTPLEVFEKVYRPTKRAGTAEALREIAEETEDKGLLEELFDYLDLPGATVRNILTGEGGRALRSAGAFVLPGIVGQPKEQPDFGFVGNLLTDPLLFLTGGGAGAARAVQTATKGIRAGTKATQAAGRALARTATKAGRREHGRLLDVLTRRAPAASVAEAREALKLGRAAKGTPGFVESLMGKGLASQGGLRVGLPFTEGRTIAGAGKAVNLAMASPYYWAGRSILRAAKDTKAGTAVHKFVHRGLRKIYPGFGMSESGRALAAMQKATERRLTAEYAKEVQETFKPFDRDALQDFTQTLAGRDLRKSGVVDAATFKAKHPQLAAHYDEALTRYKTMTDRTREELIDRGIWSPDIEARENYFPQQYTDEVMEAIEKANWEAELAGGSQIGKVKGAGPYGAAVKNAFMKARTFTEQDDFLEHVQGLVEKAGKAGKKVKHLQELDIAQLSMKRMQSHARTLATHDMIRDARRTFRFKGAPQQWAKMAPDPVFGEWIAHGAGQLKKREGVMAAVDFVNRKGFKPFVTVGVGPIPNPAFHIRNIISGVWQAAAHPEIGLASGVRHIGQIFYDAVAKAVEKVPGITNVPRSRLTYIVRASKGGAEDLARLTDKVVKGTPYTERQIAELLRKHGVTRNAYVTAEQIYDALEPVRAMGARGARKIGRRVYEAVLGTKFPAYVAESIEDRMRANGFVHALRKGLDPQDAARATREAFIDYEMVSNLHRNIRDVIPFAQFTIGQTPRTLKTILERPRALSPLVAAGAGREGSLLPPWVREQPSFDLGADEEGNRAVLSGLGTPFEDLGKFWAGSFGRTLERGGAGSLSPPLKTVYEQMSGRDPFFGRGIHDYRRETPVASVLPDFLTGRRTRTIGKGAEKRDVPEVSPKLNYWLQKLPWARQMSMANQLFDTRKKTWHKSISLLTGARVVSVDEDTELRKLILDYLKKQADEGNVGVFQKFFAYGDTDPQLSAMVKAYYAAKGKGR